MRTLTLSELELVAGGSTTNLPGPTVTPPSGGDDWSGDQGVNLGTDPGDGRPDGGGGGGDDGASGNPGYHAHTPAQIHAVSEALAATFAREVALHSDHNSSEYEAIIYKDSQGDIHLSTIVHGATDTASLTLPDGVTASDIIGVVHNHPELITNDNATAEHIQEFPSSDRYANHGTSDWAAADSLVAHGADASQLTMYILGPDNTMREYNYSDEAKYQNVNATTRPGHTIPESTPMPSY